MNRNLDYRYFPMQRENGLEYVCFTDLKTYERDRILKAQSQYLPTVTVLYTEKVTICQALS